MKNSEISDFYDDYTKRQVKTGANERLISLYQRAKKAGLNKNSNVLELGCGVGIFTQLLAKTVTKGYIEAMDFSPKSVEIATKFQKKNITFEVGNAVEYQPKHKRFDFITLMDVIEHIPLGQHPDLFKNLAKISDENTLILINIPNPRFIEYLHANEPETLQIIDQSVELPELIGNIDNAGLEIIKFEKYSIWVLEDYEFFIIRKKRNFEKKRLSELRSTPEKIVNRLKNTGKRLLHS